VSDFSQKRDSRRLRRPLSAAATASLRDSRRNRGSIQRSRGRISPCPRCGCKTLELPANETLRSIQGPLETKASPTALRRKRWRMLSRMRRRAKRGRRSIAAPVTCCSPAIAWNPLTGYPRNKGCFCGSGVKAKKCCLPYINRACAAIRSRHPQRYLAEAHDRPRVTLPRAPQAQKKLDEKEKAEAPAPAPAEPADAAA
jgi:hypothetical protein